MADRCFCHGNGFEDPRLQPENLRERWSNIFDAFIVIISIVELLGFGGGFYFCLEKLSTVEGFQACEIYQEPVHSFGNRDRSFLR